MDHMAGIVACKRRRQRSDSPTEPPARARHRVSPDSRTDTSEMKRHGRELLRVHPLLCFIVAVAVVFLSRSASEQRERNGEREPHQRSRAAGIVVGALSAQTLSEALAEQSAHFVQTPRIMNIRARAVRSPARDSRSLDPIPGVDYW